MVFVRLVDTGRNDARDGDRSGGSEHTIRNRRARCRRRCAGAHASPDRLAPVVSLARLRIAQHAHDNGQGAGGTRTGLSLSPAEKPETASITPGAYRCGSRRVRCRVGCEGARSSDRKREASACTPPQMPLPCTRSSLSAWAMQHRPLASESMRVRPPFRAARTR